MRFLLITLAAVTASAFAAPAAPPFKGPDLLGTYDCKGQDEQEGPYTSIVTLDLVQAQSAGRFGAYTFHMQVPGFGSYPGHAAAVGTNMAIYFALTDPAPKDYGTGIVQFTKAAGKKWKFTKHYYEPAFKGGNRGTEICVQQ